MDTMKLSDSISTENGWAICAGKYKLSFTFSDHEAKNLISGYILSATDDGVERIIAQSVNAIPKQSMIERVNALISSHRRYPVVEE